MLVMFQLYTVPSVVPIICCKCYEQQRTKRNEDIGFVYEQYNKEIKEKENYEDWMAINFDQNEIMLMINPSNYIGQTRIVAIVKCTINYLKVNDISSYMIFHYFFYIMCILI
eukprot:142902_1